MDRRERITKKITKVGLSKGHLTENDIDSILDEYISGTKQNFKGDTIAAVVEKFFAKQPVKVRDSFTRMADEIVEWGKRSDKKFRQRILLNLIIAYQNGTVDGSIDKKIFDLGKLIEDTQKELDKSPKYRLIPKS